MPMPKQALIALIFSFASLASLQAVGTAPDFRKDIQPVLETNCIKCHGADKQKGDLQLHTRAAMLAGGDIQIQRRDQ